jgi:hypothetical protein
MTADIIPFRIERQDDGELRISDIELAEHLEYSHVRVFRNVIRKNASDLRALGLLHRINAKGAGRPESVFWLTEHQAIHAVYRSDTEAAKLLAIRLTKEFVALRRGQINQKLYGAVGMELLGFAPRTWTREYPEPFFLHLHRVGGWPKPEGNNHSNCAHFINRFVYGFLFGELGLIALKEANPVDEGQRAHRHHQMLKDKHMPRLRLHIEVVTALLATNVSLDMFEDSFNRVFPKPNTQVGFLFGELPGAA